MTREKVEVAFVNFLLGYCSGGKQGHGYEVVARIGRLGGIKCNSLL